MRTLSFTALLFLSGFGLFTLLQPQPEIDPVTKETSQLEAELSKKRSTTAEAAELMLQLIDRYHEHGRVFGLVRVAQSFVSLHTSHPRHKDAMLKLMDGLRVTGRNKELIATARQFLVRYPADASCAPVESLLARLLSRNKEYAAAAANYEALWRRLGATPEGRDAGLAAVTHYQYLASPDGYTKAATVADDLLDKLPAGPHANLAGSQAVENWERVSLWAKANLSAGKLLQKSAPTAPAQLRALHARMGENYSRIGQRTNAVDSFTRAIAVAGPIDPNLFSRRLGELYGSNPKPPQFEPVVAEYAQKFPTREDRHAHRTLVGVTYVTAGDKVRAEQIFAEVLPFDSRTHGPISYYLQMFANEPARNAQAAQGLRAAIAKSTPYNAAPIRYHLALDVYRDRLKDVPTAKAVAREYLFQHPTNESYATTLLHWLLDTAANDSEFQTDFNSFLASRKLRPYWEHFRGIGAAWVATNAAKKEAAARIVWINNALAQANGDPVFADWLALEKATRENNAAQLNAVREKLLAPERVATLPDELANDLFYQQQYWYRHYGGAQNVLSVDWAGRWTKRLPKSETAAYNYLAWATDLGVVKDYKAAAEQYLTFEPQAPNGDIYRRLMMMAATIKDVELGKKCWAWIEKAHVKFGFDNNQATGIGDYLDQLGMKAEAISCWQRGMTSNRDVGDSRTCFDRLMARAMTEPEKAKLIDDMVPHDCYWHFNFAVLKADRLLKANDLNGFEKILRDAVAKTKNRPASGWSPDTDYTIALAWVNTLRADMKATVPDKRRVYTVVRDLQMYRPSQAAAAALLELPDEPKMPAMQRLLALNEATLSSYGDTTDWDILMTYAQSALARKDYSTAASLLGGMLANCPAIDEGRRKPGRDMITQAYSRMGAAGAAIDDKSPLAPLLQAALHLRLGDQKLAFDTYIANQKLFDEHRHEVPIDLLLFVCESHMAGGGDDNANRVEDILRAWLIKNSEIKEIDDVEKAQVQLLLARNYFKSKRYDLARAEFTSVHNRYAKTPQAVEGEFGIGETFMEQKVYDQAEQVFERLAGSRERDVVIRAEFLRGVLASRRGDRDDARAIFRRVLERVPNIELANQVLYNLSEVYGAEQRYVDQLELLRTVGRLGRSSKRWHTPGEALSIVVQDSDLGVSRGHARIPVRVTTEPGGDEETIFLISGGAGKGLFRADLDTRLGPANKGDRILQVTGKDVIRCDYPESFKKEFKDVPLPDAEIRIAADGKLEIGSSKIVDLENESFSDRLAREARGDEDKRRSVGRPMNQIKPGNLIYLRVIDPDRDVSDQPDTITVKLSATSGDQVSVLLNETGPHTGVFEGTAKSGELPAGALATNTAIDHSPLMAIDKDKKTSWLSEPDGATPKVLTIDMKDLKRVDRVLLSTPDANQHAPVRATLEGSDDGRLWFKLASNPADAAIVPLVGEYGRMTGKFFDNLNATGYSNWNQIVELSKTGKPTRQAIAEALAWTRAPDGKKEPVTALWQGKLVQKSEGAARLAVRADTSAILLDGQLVLPVGSGGERTADVWLDKGTHNLAIFAAIGPESPGIEATIARGDSSKTVLDILPFVERDWDLKQAEAKPALERKPGVVTVNGTDWDVKFPSIDIRFVRVIIHEYKGEAVAVNHVEVHDTDGKKVHLPTESDILSLATNDVIEIAGGDAITAGYIDEQNLTGSSRLLTAQLTATYNNGSILPIGYDFMRGGGGEVYNVRKQLLRIDPGERIVVEVTDYDMDRTAKRDEIKVFVRVNDTQAYELKSTETDENTGTFTREIDTTDKVEEGKLTVKAGDRVHLWYVDQQNTLPGHSVKRETVVYVNEATEGRVRVLETRVIPSKEERGTPTLIYLPNNKEKKIAGVAFNAPLTLEVIDPDAAKDSNSKVVVTLITTDGAKVEVECILSDLLLDSPNQRRISALEEGRFTGQVILQLGGKDSSPLVPLTADMPRNLIGGPKLAKEEGKENGPDKTLVTGVLNLTGKDVIDAVYVDAQRLKDPGTKLTAQARMITDGRLTCTDSDYQKELTAVHVGERVFLRVIDADLDRSNLRDKAKVVITTKRGEQETVELEETLVHSGVFTGSVTLRPEEKPTAGNMKAEAPIVECFFGDVLELVYADELTSTKEGPDELKVEIKVVIGTDGKLAAFSKKFSDEALAVETQFHIAESHFELFKSHKTLGREAEARADLEAGRRILREVMEDYPNPKYTPRVAYLLGQFSQEQGAALKRELIGEKKEATDDKDPKETKEVKEVKEPKEENTDPKKAEIRRRMQLLFTEAIESYQLIVKQFPDHVLAPDAQFKMAQCYEDMEEFEHALDAYVTLAATYPKNLLIANVMLRISDHFYKEKNYKVAASVGEKFMERFDGHKWAPKMGFRVGQCYYHDKQYAKAGAMFELFGKKFSGDALAADAMFWAGESYRTGGDTRKAFACYNKCRWDFQASDAAKYARGRLALPEMQRLFEEAANPENK